MPKSVQEYYRKCGFGHSRKRRCFNWNITSLLAQSYEPVNAAFWGVPSRTTADIALPETAISLSSLRHQIFGKAFLSIKNKSPEKGLKSLYFQFVKQINQFGF
jgi:hypothetical protein